MRSGNPVPVPAWMSLRRRQDAALAPVRTAMLHDAKAEAESMVAGARRAASAQLERASADAVTAVSRAQAEGQAQAAPLALAELSRGHREARAILLEVELRTRAEVEERIRSAIGGLKDEPGYDQLRAKLADMARLAAGPGAAVAEHPSGGVVARAPGIVVDCSLPRLAERAIAALSQQIRELTAP